jgi:phosphoribosyl-AMP cyclohydrolase
MSTSFPPPGEDVETGARLTPRFNADGLVAAIAQDATSGAVLMLAWMNAEALAETLATGRATYWSRSRGRLWRKGEESGHMQRVREVRVDCDQDAVLLIVEQTGAACHTGAATCFYRRAEDGGLVRVAAPLAEKP